MTWELGWADKTPLPVVDLLTAVLEALPGADLIPSYTNKSEGSKVYR